MQMLGSQLRHGPALKGEDAGKHVLVNDGEAVLIAMNARAAVKKLRRGVNGRHAADDRTVDVFQVFDQAEVGDLDSPAHEEQVLWFDVEVLKRILLADVVQGVGRVVQMGQQLIARNAAQSGVTAL